MLLLIYFKPMKKSYTMYYIYLHFSIKSNTYIESELLAKMYMCMIIMFDTKRLCTKCSLTHFKVFATKYTFICLMTTFTAIQLLWKREFGIYIPLFLSNFIVTHSTESKQGMKQGNANTRVFTCLRLMIPWYFGSIFQYIFWILMNSL